MKKLLISFLSIIFFIFLFCGCSNINKLDNDNVYNWVYEPLVKLSLDNEMKIDGKLDESRWANKRQYVLQDDGVEMNVTTSFSEKGLYIGAVAYDTRIKWVSRMNMYANSGFYFSVKAEDVTYEVGSSTFNLYVDTKNHWNFNVINFDAKSYTVYDGEDSVSLTAELFIPWKEMKIDVSNGLPSCIKINPHYRYYDITGNAQWLQGMFAFDDRDRMECSQRFNEDGYINVDKENAVVGNAKTGYAKSDGWDLTDIDNGIVKSDVDHSQGIFFTDVCSSCYWYTVTVEVGNNIYNKDPSAAGVLDARNQIECSTFYVEPVAAKQQKATTYRTLSFCDDNRYAWIFKQEGKITPNYNAYDGKIKYTVVKDNGYFYYIINDEYVMTKYISYLKDDSCPGFYTLDAQGIFTNYEAHDLSDDRSQVDDILSEYGVYRIKIDGDVVGGEVSFSENAVISGENVTATILPANRNILTGFEINGVDCYEDVKANIVDGKYVLNNITKTTVIKPIFTRFDSLATVEVSGYLKDTSNNNASNVSVILKGSSALLYYVVISGGNGAYKFYVPKYGTYNIGGREILVDGNYEMNIVGSGYIPQSHDISVNDKITNLNYTLNVPERSNDSYGIIQNGEHSYKASDTLTSHESDYMFFDDVYHDTAVLTAKITIPEKVMLPSVYGVGFIFTNGDKVTDDSNCDSVTVNIGSYETNEIGLTEDGIFTGTRMCDTMRRPGAWGSGTWSDLQYNESGDSVWFNKTEITLSLIKYGSNFYIWIDDVFVKKLHCTGQDGSTYFLNTLDASKGLKYGVYFYQTEDVDINVSVTESYDDEAILKIRNSTLYNKEIKI